MIDSKFRRSVLKVTNVATCCLALAVILCCQLSAPASARKQKLSADERWSILVQKGLSVYRSGLDSTFYFIQAAEVAKGFPEPDIRLAGTLYKLATIRFEGGSGYLHAGSGAACPLPPWGAIPSPVAVVEEQPADSPDSQSKDNESVATELNRVKLLRQAVDVCNRLRDVKPLYRANCQLELALDLHDRWTISFPDVQAGPSTSASKRQVTQAESLLNLASDNYGKANALAEQAESLYLLGLWQDQINDCTQADKAFESALQVYKRLPVRDCLQPVCEMLTRRAMYALWQERFEDAEQLLKTATTTQLARDCPQSLVENLYYLACLQFKRSAYEEALSSISTAIHVLPNTQEPNPNGDSQVSEGDTTAPILLPPITGSQTDTVNHGQAPMLKNVTSGKLRFWHRRIKAQKWTLTPAPYPYSSDFIEPIAADEPIPPPGFPPLPRSLNFQYPEDDASKSKKMNKARVLDQQADTGSSSSSSSSSSTGTETKEPLQQSDFPMYFVPLERALIAQFSSDSFSSGDTGWQSRSNPITGIRTETVQTPILQDATNETGIQLEESERLTEEQILDQLFSRSDEKTKLPPIALMRRPALDPIVLHRLQALLIGKVRGRTSEINMDTMYNAILQRKQYVPPNEKLLARRKAAEKSIELLRANVSKAWSPPPCKQSRDSVVSVQVNSLGQLQRITMSKGSGDRKFDESVWKAITKLEHIAGPTQELVGQPIQLYFQCHVASALGQRPHSVHNVSVQHLNYKQFDRELLREAVLTRLKMRWADIKFIGNGSATASFVVSHVGQLTDLQLINSSGNIKLDQAVLKTVSDCAPYGPLLVEDDPAMTFRFTFCSKPNETNAQSRTVCAFHSPISAGVSETQLLWGIGSYLDHIQQRVNLSFFPPQATAPKVAVAAFTLDSNGALSNLSLKQSSGMPAWDKEALESLQRAAPFFPPPSELDAGMTVDLSFAYFKGLSAKFEPIPSGKGSGAPATHRIRLWIDLNSTPPPPEPPSDSPAVAQDEVDFGPYMADLQKRIKRAWFHPKDSKPVTVIFKIHKGGELSHLRLERSSGNAISDEAAINAVTNAAPFRPLPDGAPDDIDIQFTFQYNYVRSF